MMSDLELEIVGSALALGAPISLAWAILSALPALACGVLCLGDLVLNRPATIAGAAVNLAGIAVAAAAGTWFALRYVQGRRIRRHLAQAIAVCRRAGSRRPDHTRWN
jgi:hypothetical protein